VGALLTEDPRHRLSRATSPALEYSERNADAAWERFLLGEAPDALPARRHVLESWQRCFRSDVNYRGSSAPLILGAAMGSLRRDNIGLLKAAAATLAHSADLLGGTRAMMLLTDPRGVVLEAVGDVTTVHAANDIGLARGGDWKEDEAGTNGIGTALATARPVIVHAGEHYCAGIKAWSCSGAPILDPLDGSVAGILGISARMRESNAQILALAVMAAGGVEHRLLQAVQAQRLQLLEMGLEHSQSRSEDALIALDARGRILFFNPLAHQYLRARVDANVPELTRGLGLLGPKGVIDRAQVEEWMKPLVIDGELAGHLIALPPASSSRASHAFSRGADESDARRSEFDCIVGSSDALRGAIRQAQAIASVDVPVLIQGETGTGKELFARAIHGKSAHATGPFVAFNCGAISREMIASELFGYVKGAFTGASPGGRAGRFEMADGGTLCLDEVGELPLDLQPYLLRVLEEGVICRMGDNTPRRVHVRILAMTNRNLRDEVAAGRFRLDLYHRLSVVEIAVPPLRERHGDLDQLLAYFNPRVADRHQREPVTFTPAAMAALHAHSWPGNVRELRNVVERSILFARDGLADIDCLPPELANALRGPAAFQIAAPAASLGRRKDDRAALEMAMRFSGGNLSAAALMLGISRSTLYRKMERLDMRRYDPLTDKQRTTMDKQELNGA
jgi:transcriptional regulator of acetoin/glycerol metabolism